MKAHAKSQERAQKRSQKRPKHSPKSSNVWSKHKKDAQASLQRLRHTPLASAMTLFVIAIALLLPALLFVVQANLGTLMGEFRESARITIYLQDSLSDAEAEQVSEDLLSLEGVASLRLVSRQSALESFSAAAGFDRVLPELDGNPLPAAIVIQPESTTVVAALTQELGQRPDIDLVQVDEQWIQRLAAISSLINTLALVLGGVIAVGLIFIIGNTVRVSVEQRREEVRVIKLIGGTDSYIARPFLYSGLFQGLFGAVLALLLMLLIYLIVQGAVAAVADEFGNNLSIRGLSLLGCVQLLLAGALVGWLAACLAAWRTIREIDA